MKNIIILIFCCGVLVSMVGCGGNTAPLPTESPPTTVSETAIMKTPPMTTVEPTGKEKEPTPTEKQGTGNRAARERHKAHNDPQPKEQTEPTVTTKQTELTTAEITESTKETSPKTEEHQEEIYVGIQWPEVNTADIEKLIIEKINAYRIAQGDTAAMMLPGLTEVASFAFVLRPPHRRPHKRRSS